MPQYAAGRSYARVYNTPSRSDIAAYLAEAVKVSGGELLYTSRLDQSPIFLGVQSPSEDRLGLLVYPFRANHRLIKNRPADEHRLQVRYGGEKSWDVDHPVGRDVATVDTTLVVGVHLEANILIGLDPGLYDPLPMGISIEFKDAQVQAAQSSGWHVLERDNISGRRRANPRAASGLETIVMFTPERLLDYVRLERTATDLSLDPALRYAAAVKSTTPSLPAARAVASVHDLEVLYDMPANEILEVISQRNRLAVAVRGGVAEYHLGRRLEHDVEVASADSLDLDGLHDFNVTMVSGQTVRVECKNSSPKRYASGEIKVEVQKTRATQGDPAGRLYRRDQFDVIAACLFAPTGRWEFAYRSTDRLAADPRHSDRLAPLQRVTDDWARTLGEAL